MRYKHYQIECYDIENDPEALHLAIDSITVTNNYPGKKNRLDYEELGRFWRTDMYAHWTGGVNSNSYEFLKLSDTLYRRVTKGRNIDLLKGNQGVYLFFLPETHPGFNFDMYYRFCCTAYEEPLDKFYNSNHLTDIVTNIFPDFVAANKY